MSAESTVSSVPSGATNNSAQPPLATSVETAFWKSEMERLCREDENRGLRRQKEQIRKEQGDDGLKKWEKTWGRWAREQ